MAKCSPIDEKCHDAACLQNELIQLQYMYGTKFNFQVSFQTAMLMRI
jgi:hypothetical protein